ncbi:MAG: ACP phosphodiesterase [Akkermansiaceae bacterium]|nr:ACP phosphodiesterase [Akkermansiaceae bacterium]
MNFLAHFHLAKNTDASRVGALLGDFVRGTPESLRPQFPNEVIDGLALTFRRVSSRRKFLSPLVGSEEDLTSHYHSYSKAFHIFYPQVMEFAKIRHS